MKSIVTLVSVALITLHQMDATAEITTLAADRDTGMLELPGYEIENHGLPDSMGVGTFGTGLDNRSIIGFDLAPLFGQYAQINSITLRLFVKAADDPGASVLTTEVHAISSANADWVEGSGGITIGGLPGDSTWAERHRGTTPGVNGTRWAGSAGLNTPGTDYDPFILATQSFNTAPTSGTQVDFTFAGGAAGLTALIDAWSISNAGLLLFDPVLNGGSQNRISWYSRQAVNPALRPQLVVDFSDAVLTVPEPASLSIALLFTIVGSAAVRIGNYQRTRRI